MIGLGSRRFKDFKSVLHDADEIGVTAKLLGIEASESGNRSGHVVDVEPTFMSPAESVKELLERLAAQMSFGKCEQLPSTGEATGLGCMPSELWQTTPECIGRLNRPRWREPRRHEHSIPVDEVGVLACPVPILWCRNHK